jgi:hypothetical protein
LRQMPFLALNLLLALQTADSVPGVTVSGIQLASSQASRQWRHRVPASGPSEPGGFGNALVGQAFFRPWGRNVEKQDNRIIDLKSRILYKYKG